MSFSLESPFKDPTALLEKSRGISPVLVACPYIGYSDSSKYAVIFIFIIIIIIIIK